MSVGETSIRLRRPNTRFLRSELWLIFGRRRNWFGLAVLASVPIVIAIAFKVDGSESGSGTGMVFFNSITDNGLFVALGSLMMEAPFFLPIAIASISADSLAGEANLGTMRYLLAVPVLRGRLLAVKYLAIVIFSFAATLLIAVTGMAIGLALFGGGSMVSLSGTELSFGEGLLRILLVCGYLGVQMSALGAIGLFVSSLTEQPIGATISIMVLVLLSTIIGTIPQMEALGPYLFTTYWLDFADLLRDPIAMEGAQDGLLNAGAYIAIFCSAAWARFMGKDITS